MVEGSEMGASVETTPSIHNCCDMPPTCRPCYHSNVQPLGTTTSVEPLPAPLVAWSRASCSHIFLAFVHPRRCSTAKLKDPEKPPKIEVELAM